MSRSRPASNPVSFHKHTKQYRPKPAKRVYIPKNEHEKRPLGLPSIKDKVVQKGISRILRKWFTILQRLPMLSCGIPGY